VAEKWINMQGVTLRVFEISIKRYINLIYYYVASLQLEPHSGLEVGLRRPLRRQSFSFA